MAESETLHTFRGEIFNVSVKRVIGSGNVFVAIVPSEAQQWLRLSLYQFLLQDAADAYELSGLLSKAATLANHLQDGGSFEKWRP